MPMTSMHEHDAADVIRPAVAGTPFSLRLPAFSCVRMIAAALLLSCSAVAQAALIEIPDYQQVERGSSGNDRNSLLSWQDNTHRAYLNGYGIFPVTYGAERSNHLALDVMHALGTGKIGRTLRVADTYGSSSDLYAAIDSPYGSLNSSKPSGDSDPELWTIVLVAAGLIGYQIRRKSRIGAIRVRPLQTDWPRLAG
jgi:hypothetical protein